MKKIEIEKLRETYKINEDMTEERIEFKDLKKGDEFILFEKKNRKSKVAGDTSWIADEDANIKENENHYGIVCHVREQ